VTHPNRSSRRVTSKLRKVGQEVPELINRIRGCAYQASLNRIVVIGRLTIRFVVGVVELMVAFYRNDRRLLVTRYGLQQAVMKYFILLSKITH